MSQNVSRGHLEFLVKLRLGRGRIVIEPEYSTHIVDAALVRKCGLEFPEQRVRLIGAVRDESPRRAPGQFHLRAFGRGYVRRQDIHAKRAQAEHFYYAGRVVSSLRQRPDLIERQREIGESQADERGAIAHRCYQTRLVHQPERFAFDDIGNRRFVVTQLVLRHAEESQRCSFARLQRYSLAKGVARLGIPARSKQARAHVQPAFSPIGPEGERLAV